VKDSVCVGRKMIHNLFLIFMRLSNVDLACSEKKVNRGDFGQISSVCTRKLLSNSLMHFFLSGTA
jgi:hypothetical protein